MACTLTDRLWRPLLPLGPIPTHSEVRQILRALFRTNVGIGLPDSNPIASHPGECLTRRPNRHCLLSPGFWKPPLSSRSIRMIQNSEFVMHYRYSANAYLEQLPRRATDMCINSRVLERKISAQSDDGKNPRVFLEQLTEHENKRTKKLCDMTFLRRALVSRALVGVSSFRQGQTSYTSFHHRRDNKIANRIQPTHTARGWHLFATATLQVRRAMTRKRCGPPNGPNRKKFGNAK